MKLLNELVHIGYTERMDAKLVQLTPEQAALLHTGEEVRMLDPATQRIYVIMPDERLAELRRKLGDLINEVNDRVEDSIEQEWWLDVARRGRELLEQDHSSDS